MVARILLVEDEGLIRLVTAEYLRDEGFEVVEAWDGDEAARLLDACDGFDVLFTDVRMPGMLDGVDVAVRARRQYPELPVLVVSGYAAHAAARTFVAADGSRFIAILLSERAVLSCQDRSMNQRPLSAGGEPAPDGRKWVVVRQGLASSMSALIDPNQHLRPSGYS